MKIQMIDVIQMPPAFTKLRTQNLPIRPADNSNPRRTVGGARKCDAGDDYGRCSD